MIGSKNGYWVYDEGDNQKFALEAESSNEHGKNKIP